jgi:hypothetical protein
LQSKNPVVHRILHTPVMHTPVAFGALEQTVPHVPHEIALFCKSASHPFDAMPSQFAKFVTHAMPHAPLVHAGVAFVAPEHTVGHVPQWFTSVRKFASQPFAATPSQSAKPGVHATEHMPAVHAAN